MLSVIFAMIVPVFLTGKILYLRLSEDFYSFNLFDLAIDAQIYQYMVSTILYLIYITQNEFRVNELLEGSIAGIFLLLGDLFRCLAFRNGPGGPIAALCSTLIIYQTILNALLFD